MYKIKDMSFAAIGGATIGVASFVGNVIRLGYAWDQILIPLMFLGFKNKRKTMPMIWPAIIACIILSGYKFYLGFFIFGYYMIAETVYKFGHKINLKSLITISFVYIIGYFGMWVIVGHIIHGIELSKVVHQITGTIFQSKMAITFVLVFEPIVFSIFYQTLFEWIKKTRIFND